MQSIDVYESLACADTLQKFYGYFKHLTLNQPMMHICVMSVLLFFHKSIRIYMEVIILGANTLYSVLCFFKALLLKQVWSGMAGKGLTNVT